MSMEALQAREDLMKSIENFLKKFNRISFQKMQKVLMQAWDKFLEIKHAQSEDIQELLNKLVEDVRSINEELAEFTNTPSWNLPNTSYDDDDDEESFLPLKDIIISGLPPCVAITPILFTEEPVDSLIMENEHFDTIPATESDEFIKSSVENLVPTPSESKDASNGECDLPVCDDFPKSHLVTFSNPLFDIDDDCTSSDDELFSEEDVPMENFKIFSNPLFDFDEEIIAIEIDSLLDEFTGELTLLKSISSGIDNDNLDPEGEIHLVESLLYDNSSPRPPEDTNSDVSNAITESFSPSPIPFEDNDSLMEEIDLFLTPDDSMPPGIENADYDSEGDILFLEELLSNDSSSLLENESFHFNIPSSPRPPAKPLDDGIYFEPDTGILTVKVVGNISEHHVLTPRLLPTQPTLASNEERSPHFLSHRGFKAYQLFFESPMMIFGGDIPILDVLEEIDIFPGPDDSIPPGIESDDYDSEVDDNSTSLPEFESFHVDYPDSGDSTIDVVEDIPVDVPNILPTHPTLHMDFDFIPSHNDLRSDLDVSSPSRDRNKIYDPGICIEVKSTRFLATHSPVIDTLLPFSSENKDKVFNHGVLASKEKSPPSSSHRGFKASKLFHQKSPMLIYGENIPILDVSFLHFYPP
ncbi:hypothetical protein Tco_0914214 [Tanacetum coccineum]